MGRPVFASQKRGVESCTSGIGFALGRNGEKLFRAILRGGEERSALGKLKHGVRVDPHAYSFGEVARKISHAGGKRSYSEHILSF